MDNIKFEITEVKKCGNLNQYDVIVILNDVPLIHRIFNGGSVVPLSAYDSGEFDLFTCGCGVPGCAGFHAEVIQNKTETTVKWQFPSGDSYSVEKLEYEFDRV